VARVSEELGVRLITLYTGRKTWWLQGEVLMEIADLNATELSAYYRDAVVHQCLSLADAVARDQLVHAAAWCGSLAVSTTIKTLLQSRTPVR
jgi:hypothetical protein